jgi:hypothetical protein
MPSLICARFQPDWGKPNVRLIGGREETDASRLVRAARGVSRLPDHDVARKMGLAMKVGEHRQHAPVRLWCRWQAELMKDARDVLLDRALGDHDSLGDRDI